jgi:hypothetical protein
VFLPVPSARSQSMREQSCRSSRPCPATSPLAQSQSPRRPPSHSSHDPTIRSLCRPLSSHDSSGDGGSRVPAAARRCLGHERTRLTSPDGTVIEDRSVHFPFGPAPARSSIDLDSARAATMEKPGLPSGSVSGCRARLCPRVNGRACSRVRAAVGGAAYHSGGWLGCRERSAGCWRISAG